MTRKLYDEDAYKTSFTATVVSCEKCPETVENAARYKVILDATCFFPEEGGQTPDKGVLGGYKVVDVQIKNDIITHTIETGAGEAPALKPGENVNGEIDWDHRYSNMQQHTGEHVFSGLVNSKFGHDNVGFHLSDSIVTMDYNGPITDEELKELEIEANKVITRQIPVETGYPDDRTLASLDYRCKKELTGAIRIVNIPGVDTCACCAPHLRNTGEIGLLKVLDMQNHKGGVRISILCGFRALTYFAHVTAQLREISHLVSAPLLETAAAVSRLKGELEEAKFALGAATRKMLDIQISMIADNTANPIIFTENADTASVRDAVNTMVKRFPGYCFVFNGNDENGYSFIAGSSDLNCNEIAGKLREKFSAKCGGKPVMIQGQINASRSELLSLLEDQD